MMHQREPLRLATGVEIDTSNAAVTSAEAAYDAAAEEVEFALDPVEKIEVLSELIHERLVYLEKSARLHPLRGDIGDWRMLKALTGLITEQAHAANDKLSALRAASNALGEATRAALSGQR